jgi:hypothetical protein
MINSSKKKICMKKLFFLLVLAFIFSGRSYSQIPGQNNTCEHALPFCTGTQYNFPAGVNAGAGQSGPCYSCLTTRPNPAWYYMKVKNSGNIVIGMHSSPLVDIDFCCWGPFTSQDACTQLTCNKVVSCSYSTAATETCNIPNGITGQYYILIITNFSNDPCNIIFSQTGGTGSTDCSILPPPCNSNSPICAGQTLQLNATAIAGASYRWSGPNNFHSTQQNPSIPNAQPINSGNYYLNIMIAGQPSVDSSRTIVHVYKPIANAGNDTTIPNGVYTTLHGSVTGGSGHFTYHWEPADKLVNPNLKSPQTVNLYTSTIFTFTAKDDSASCTSQDNMTVNLAGGALGVGLGANPPTICRGETSQLQASGSGGAGNYTYKWYFPNGDSTTIQNPTVQPTTTSTYSCKVSDGYNTSTNTVTVTVIQLPVADAGSGISIPYGTYVFLQGSATGGSGDYFYSWTPADKLLNSNVQSPQTINLTGTTLYTLAVSDLGTGCNSDNVATVNVEVTGGPLSVSPVAVPPAICIGETTQLHASAGGGNIGFYSYEWGSNPPGFTSADPDPIVTPTINTTYSVTVNDGYNSISGNTLVTIYPSPYIHMGPRDSTVCTYATVTLDAGNPGSTYLWSTGETGQHIDVISAGLGYEVQEYKVQVTNEHGCISLDSIFVHYSFAACTGINEQEHTGIIRIYPNPNSGRFTIEATGFREEITATIMSAIGQKIKTFILPNTETGKTVMTADLLNLPQGIYLVRFESDNFLKTEKLVIR